MKIAVLAALVGSAAAFAPAQTGRVATDLAVSELEVRNSLSLVGSNVAPSQTIAAFQNLVPSRLPSE